MKEIARGNIISVRELRLDEGDEAITEIADYCAKERIHAGWIEIIGACSEVELYFYNPATKKYEDKKFPGPREVLPVDGNIALYHGKPMAHIHGSFSDGNFEVIGGHVNSLIASATLEVKIEVFSGDIVREDDLRTCLKLMVAP